MEPCSKWRFIFQILEVNGTNFENITYVKVCFSSSRQRRNSMTVSVTCGSHAYDAYITHLNEIKIGRKLLKALKAPWHWCVFVWKCIHLDAFRPSFHTNTLSIFIEDASIWKRSWKWIKTKTHTYCISVHSQKRSKNASKWNWWPKIS